MKHRPDSIERLVWLVVQLAVLHAACADEWLDAVQRGDVASVTAALAAHPALAKQADGKGHTILHWAAAGDHCEIVLALLAKGAAVDVRDGFGYTPLHWAADAGATKTAELLRDKAADVNACALNRQTPLHRAAFGGRGPLVEWLLAHGADHNATDYRVFTPLHYATSVEAAAALLAKGADINARPNNYSMTPLAAAAQRGNAEVVRFLLEKGADPSLADDMLFTPLHWAAWAGSRESVKLLLP